MKPTGCLIIRNAPSAKAQNAQWAYVGRYLFYFVCQKLSFCDALRSFHWASSNKNINRVIYIVKIIRSCPQPRNYITPGGELRGWIYARKSITYAHFRQGNPIRIKSKFITDTWKDSSRQSCILITWSMGEPQPI